MASKAAALIFILSNVLFFAMVASSSSDLPALSTECQSCTKPANPDHHHGSHGGGGKCPTLNLGVCANVLNLVKLKIGNPPKEPCCSLIPGVLDLEAALCLCTDIKLDVLGIVKLNLPLSLELLVGLCDIKLPKDFKCPA
ncbi:putative lipid-binding protein AIR1B [Andrographis paniculata]|uniref:putative lipid-binding protein AIR1B n=1 Tax=Andrographis paniculata TaxID=175694 RepID=UPI0021E91D88|nr:putative lipid-binding protein AIR1B [Andrographis paniculata]